MVVATQADHHEAAANATTRRGERAASAIGPTAERAERRNARERSRAERRRGICRETHVFASPRAEASRRRRGVGCSLGDVRELCVETSIGDSPVFGGPRGGDETRELVEATMEETRSMAAARDALFARVVDCTRGLGGREPSPRGARERRLDAATPSASVVVARGGATRAAAPATVTTARGDGAQLVVDLVSKRHHSRRVDLQALEIVRERATRARRVRFRTAFKRAVRLPEATPPSSSRGSSARARALFAVRRRPLDRRRHGRLRARPARTDRRQTAPLPCRQAAGGGAGGGAFGRTPPAAAFSIFKSTISRSSSAAGGLRVVAGAFAPTWRSLRSESPAAMREIEALQRSMGALRVPRRLSRRAGKASSARVRVRASPRAPSSGLDERHLRLELGTFGSELFNRRSGGDRARLRAARRRRRRPIPASRGEIARASRSARHSIEKLFVFAETRCLCSCVSSRSEHRRASRRERVARCPSRAAVSSIIFALMSKSPRIVSTSSHARQSLHVSFAAISAASAVSRSRSSKSARTLSMSFTAVALEARAAGSSRRTRPRVFNESTSRAHARPGLDRARQVVCVSRRQDPRTLFAACGTSRTGKRIRGGSPLKGALHRPSHARARRLRALWGGAPSLDDAQFVFSLGDPPLRNTSTSTQR